MSVAATSDEVAVRVGLSDPVLQLEVIATLAVDVEIPDGLHAYAPGAPSQFTPLAIEVGGTGLRLGTPRWPEPESLDMTEPGLTVPVLSGTVRVGFSTTLSGSRSSKPCKTPQSPEGLQSPTFPEELRRPDRHQLRTVQLRLVRRFVWRARRRRLLPSARQPSSCPLG